MKILIVDDVPPAVELIRETLVRAGLAVPLSDEIRAAHSVQEARGEILRHRPELLILDEVLPGESPMDLLQEPAILDIPVILVSATAATAKMPHLPASAKVLGRVSKWGWNEVDRVAGDFRQMLQRFP
jgi:DNA-binding response OmpR family regulator